jgi:hypothetical protein
LLLTAALSALAALLTTLTGLIGLVLLTTLTGLIGLVLLTAVTTATLTAALATLLTAALLILIAHCVHSIFSAKYISSLTTTINLLAAFLRWRAQNSHMSPPTIPAALCRAFAAARHVV